MDLFSAEQKLEIANLVVFPTLVNKVNLKNLVSKEELFIMKSLDKRANTGNSSSIDTYVLNNVKLKSLRTKLTEVINEIFKEAYKPLDGLSLRITQSWVNWTNMNEYHHEHHHLNSAYSAVFYLETEEGDSISFHDSRQLQLHFEKKEQTIFNSTTWTIPVEKNSLVLFPSWLPHSVVRKDHEGKRISLAINTFFVGKLGDDRQLTALNLGERHEL